MSDQHVLLIDDDGEALLSLNRALKASGLEAHLHAASGSVKAIELLKEKSPQVAVVDLCLDERQGVESGFSLIREIIELDQTCRVIVLTGHGSIEHGVRSLQQGCASFLEKPADVAHLLALIRDGIRQSSLKRAYIARERDEQGQLSSILIGQGERIKELWNAVDYAAQNNQPVLLTGETGTGKGLCALAIHQRSARSTHTFVRYQPHYGNSDMVNSDLFGHQKGAFTGAQHERRGLLAEAHQGTLFLDEIDELPLETQVTLLGVLQEKKYRSLGSNREEESNFRLICASNQDINRCVESGKLRKDFYHRIAHCTVDLPPLRTRKDDIPLLVDHFLNKLRTSEQVNVYSADEAALIKLKAHEWPGNVRELEAIVEGAAYRAQYNQRPHVTEQDIQIRSSENNDKSLSFNEQVDRYRIKLVNEALARNENNQVKAARELGIDRSTLRRILS